MKPGGRGSSQGLGSRSPRAAHRFRASESRRTWDQGRRVPRNSSEEDAALPAKTCILTNGPDWFWLCSPGDNWKYFGIQAKRWNSNFDCWSFCWIFGWLWSLPCLQRQTGCQSVIVYSFLPGHHNGCEIQEIQENHACWSDCRVKPRDDPETGPTVALAPRGAKSQTPII